MNPAEKEPRYNKNNHYTNKCEKVEMSHLSASISSYSVSSCSSSHNSNRDCDRDRDRDHGRSSDMSSCKGEEVEMKPSLKRLTRDVSLSNGSSLKEEDRTKRFEGVKTRKQKRRSSYSRSATVSESASGGTNERNRERLKLNYKNRKEKGERKNSATKNADVHLDGRKRNALFGIKRNGQSEGLGRTLGREREEEKSRRKSREKDRQEKHREEKYRNHRRESPKHFSVHKMNEREKNSSDNNMGKSERTGRELGKENANLRNRKREHYVGEISEERVKKKHKFSDSSESDKSVDKIRHTTNLKKTKRSVSLLSSISSSGSSNISGSVGSTADDIHSNNSSSSSNSSNSSSNSSSSINTSSRRRYSSCSGISSKGSNRSRGKGYGKRRSDRNYKRRDNYKINEKHKKKEANKKGKGKEKRKGSVVSESSEEEVKERKATERKNKSVKSNVKETEHRDEYKGRSLSSVSKSVSTLSSEREKKIKKLKKEMHHKRSSSSDNSDIKKKKKLKKKKYEQSEISSMDSRSATLSSSEEMIVSRNKEKKKRGNTGSLKMHKKEKKDSDISSTDSEATSTDSGQEMKRKTTDGKRKRVSNKKDGKDGYHEKVSIKKNEMYDLKERKVKEKEEEEEEEEYDPLKEDDKEKMEINEELIEYAKKKIANVTIEDVGKFGGVYIPPFKIERLQNEVTDTNNVLYQQQEWMKLKKKINNIVNKVNVDNIGDIVYELFECNLIRGKGLFSRALIHAQLSSPAFTNVFASLLAIVNSKFPNIGLLTVQRVILHFRRAYKRNDKITCYSSVKFIAHMINQRVLHEVVGLQLCSLLLQNITNDSVQVCTFFIAEVGQLYTEICRKGLDLIFERLKDILQEGKIQIKTQYDIEKLWDYRKNNFEKFPTVIKKLDLIDDDDKIVHEIDLLDESFTNEEELNIFREVSPKQYEAENEEWKKISDELLNGSDSDEREGRSSDEEEMDDSDGVEENEESDNSSVDSEEAATKKKRKRRGTYENEFDSDSNSGDSSGEDEKDKEEVTDMTEQYLINLRKSVYLSIMSSLSFEECVHKLLKLHIKPGYEIEICNMLIDCCCMEKTFQTFYALQAERLCKLRKCYQECFEKCFEKSYNTAHRLETAKLRNCSKFFAHLLYTDAISWSVFKIIVLTEESTTSSTRIFIKILIQELTNNLGLRNLYEKMNHPAIAPFLTGLFPTDSPPNIRFCINYFTAIGLGALTTPLRKLLQG